MRLSTDITDSPSTCVEFEYALLNSLPPRKLDSRIVLDFWGLLLCPNEIEDPQLIQLPFSTREHNVIIAGWAQMWFEDPVSLVFRIAIEDKEGGAFIRDAQGQVVAIEQSLTSHWTGHARQYEVGGHSLWPNGDANISIRALGKAGVDFRTEDCMSAEQFYRRESEITFPT